MSSVPPKQSVYSGVCHRLALTSKIAIRLTLSRPLIHHKYNIDHHTHQEKKSNK